MSSVVFLKVKVLAKHRFLKTVKKLTRLSGEVTFTNTRSNIV